MEVAKIGGRGVVGVAGLAVLNGTSGPSQLFSVSSAVAARGSRCWSTVLVCWVYRSCCRSGPSLRSRCLLVLCPSCTARRYKVDSRCCCCCIVAASSVLCFQTGQVGRRAPGSGNFTKTLQSMFLRQRFLSRLGSRALVDIVYVQRLKLFRLFSFASAGCHYRHSAPTRRIHIRPVNFLGLSFGGVAESRMLVKSCQILVLNSKNSRKMAKNFLKFY